MLRTRSLLYHPILFRLKSRPQILQQVIRVAPPARGENRDGRDFVHWLPIWSRARLLSRLGVRRSDFFPFLFVQTERTNFGTESVFGFD